MSLSPSSTPGLAALHACVCHMALTAHVVYTMQTVNYTTQKNGSCQEKKREKLRRTRKPLIMRGLG